MNRVLCINTGGIGDLHGIRARMLASHLEAEVTYVDVDKSQSRRKNARVIWKLLRSHPWDLVYQEATGIAGGLNLIRAAMTWGQRYVVSTGDPVGGYFHNVRGPVIGAGFEVYERVLYRQCTGFIGWTPYLTGMALKMGAPRAVTVEGGVDLAAFVPPSDLEKAAAKRAIGFGPEDLVCGVVGSLTWSPRQQYCYGLELVSMLHYLTRRDVRVVIVGDGTGRDILEARIPADRRDQVVLTGRVPHERVSQLLQAMDVGFITQTLDGLGSYRLTTKLPEYLAAGLPVAMSPVPGFYDYVWPAGWALPPQHPASDAFHRGCAQWLDTLTLEEVRAKAVQARPIAEQRFDYEVLARRFACFVHELMGVPVSTGPASPRLLPV
ncbi:MAG: glycosyltransferase [Bacteroidetes bacterium]|jgi:hypothetical protein|nr:glycosyltransferase [Bacteroidota bacterium]